MMSGITGMISAQSNSVSHKLAQTTKFALSAAIITHLVWRTQQPNLIGAGVVAATVIAGAIDFEKKDKNLHLCNRGWRPVFSGALAASLFFTANYAFKHVQSWTHALQFGLVPALSTAYLIGFAKDDQALRSFVTKWS